MKNLTKLYIPLTSKLLYKSLPIESVNNIVWDDTHQNGDSSGIKNGFNALNVFFKYMLLL